MKTSEEKLNEALQAALKRKFDDFEDQPAPAAYRNIRASLKQPRTYKYLLLSLLVLFIFVGGVTLDQYWMGRVAGGKTPATAAAGKKTAVKVAGKPAEMRAAGGKTLATAAARKTPATAAVRTASVLAIVRITPSPARVPAVASVLHRKHLAPVSAFKPANPGESKSNSRLPLVDSMASPVAMVSHQNETGLYLSPGLLESRQAGWQRNTLQLPVVTTRESEKPHAIHTKLQRVSWIFNLSGLKTYQILSVPESVEQNFQNFRFPAAFAFESIGYKMSAGFEKKGFQVLLHYSSFRQSYSYEVAGNEYVLEQLGLTDYKFVRPGTIVQENRKMDLLGVGLRKEVLWGNSFSAGYFASVGVEYAQALQSQQGTGWINAGLGRQLPLSRKAVLHLGPYAEFTPFKIKGQNSLILNQPYRVGISMSLKLVGD